MDSKYTIYEKLSRLVDSQSIISITSDSWRELSGLWNLLESQLRTWEGLLDSRLGGALGAAGAWLARAEILIHTDDIPPQMNEGTAAVISRKLEEHKLFFADLPTVLEKFEKARASPAARDVPPAQLQSMTARFATIGTRAAQRRVKLKFLEHKVCIITITLVKVADHVCPTIVPTLTHMLTPTFALG